ncbi:MAG: anaerobic glycerol-3-phosphate dehydrogenase subunit A [Thermodesulfobacteriota bacterium]
MSTVEETPVLIIGGGVTGVGLARDLTLRGVPCTIVERRDVNSGASGGNHGLLHSGCRYVLQDVETAAECMAENELLKRMAAQCIEPTGGLFVAMNGEDLAHAGRFEEACAESGIDVCRVAPEEVLEMEPAVGRGVLAAYLTPDAVVDPFRLAFENLFDAMAHGAKLMCFSPVEAMTVVNGAIREVTLHNPATGDIQHIRPRIVVNAAGAWAGKIAHLAGLSLPMVYSKGTLVISHERIAERVLHRLRPPADGDILVPGGTVSIAGTSSLRVEEPDRLLPTTDEVDMLVREMGVMVPDFVQTRLIRAYCGVRPLVGTHAVADGRSIRRNFVLIDHAREGIHNLVTITGGKLTTYRLMAERTADLVCEKLRHAVSCTTGTVPLPEHAACQWSEPGRAPRYWMKAQQAGDLLLCECEMVPKSAIDCILETLNTQHVPAGLKAIGVRSRIGKGPCQGAYCSVRIISHLYDRGWLQGRQGGDELAAFLRERWKGMQAVLWGEQMRHAELQEAIHCGLFEMEHPHVQARQSTKSG